MYKNSSSFSQKIIADSLLERIPMLAISGEDIAVDRILDEVLELLITQVNADIGQINLLPKAGRVEKLRIIKDRQPWLQKEKNMHLFDPSKGFTGEVIAKGKSILVDDIWAQDGPLHTNPFLELAPEMNSSYIEEIKKPVASMIIIPIKRGEDIFCTVELCRYRGKTGFTINNQFVLDEFAKQYGSLIMDYVLDIKNRIAIKTAHKRLLNFSRATASNKPVDYQNVVEPYAKLSAADIVLAFFKTGSIHDSSYRMVVWQDDKAVEILLNDFMPSNKSILRDDIYSLFPVEGMSGDDRLLRFRNRIMSYGDISKKKRDMVDDIIKMVKSYVVFPLHTLSQELGAIVLGSCRPKFWPYLNMNPFLDLYNSLLKSFLLNERVIQYLSDISLKIHNPGYYCLGSLKGAIAEAAPQLLTNPKITAAFNGLDKMFGELHDQGKVLRWRNKHILFVKWLQVFVNRKSSDYPGLKIVLKYNPDDNLKWRILASDEQLETIFENLISNSVRAIAARQHKEDSLVGEIKISLERKNNMVEVKIQDNGILYNTVSGRGVNQIKEEMEALGGTALVEKKPYLTRLVFPIS